MIGEYEDVHFASPEIVTVQFRHLSQHRRKCFLKAHEFVEAVQIAISFELQYQLGRQQCSLVPRK